ncbi:MAG: HD domain-containing protein [Chloroflexota bacterium]
MIPYRVKQVIWALTARPLGQSDLALLDEVLSPQEKDLFLQFTSNDQNHSIRVVKIVLCKPDAALSLQKAALLHDIGKTRVGKLSVINRSIAVAVKYLMPGRSKAWGSLDLEKAKRYQLPSIVRAQHADWGAEMVKALGGDELTVRLIRRHQDKLGEIVSDEDYLLTVLQAADDVS